MNAKMPFRLYVYIFFSSGAYDNTPVGKRGVDYDVL